MRCPSCGSSYFLPSRARNVFERVRRALSNRVLYRCQKCELRLWLDEDEIVDEDGDPDEEGEHQAEWRYFSPADEPDPEKRHS